MFKICKPCQLSVIVLFLFAMSACSPATPTSAPTVEVVHQCSVIVADGQGWNSVLAGLGGDSSSNLLVNGIPQRSSGTLQPGDVVVLAEKPAKCEGSYIAARVQSFAYGHNVVVSGFKSPITDKDLYQALADTCRAVRWYEDGKLGFNGDINTGGCNYLTVVKTSRDDGNSTCTAFSSATDAYNTTVAFNLSRIKSLAVLIANDNSITLDEAHAQYCK